MSELIKNHEFVESKLNIKLSDQYVEFLDNFGDYEYQGGEIYGYSSEYIFIDKIPCVIGATRLYKDSHHLKDSEIAISHSGFEDVIVVLDNLSGNIIEIRGNGTRIKIDESFDNWFSRIRNTD
jgi:hypothetical protein